MLFISICGAITSIGESAVLVQFPEFLCNLQLRADAH